METLEKIQTKHSAILKTIDQINSILAPINTGTEKHECLNIFPENIERLAKQSDFLSNDFMKCSVVTEMVGTKGQGNYTAMHHINLEGDGFGFSFIPTMVRTVKRGLEKRFKEVETFTCKNEKTRQQEPAPIKEPVKVLNKRGSLLINNSNKLHNNSNNAYFCQNNELDMVTLQIKKAAFDLIKAGTKKTDWRAPSRFNKKRLLSVDDNGLYTVNTSIKEIKFINGRKPDAPALIAEVIEIRPYKFTREVHIPEDDFKGHTGQCAIAIKLGKIKQVFN